MKYTLGPTEVILLPETPAVRGRNNSCDLLLTNLNLVAINKGMFGNSVFGSPKSVDMFPVNEIKIYNGQAQAQVATSRGSEVLRVYFRHGEEDFRFVDGGKKTIPRWIAKINEAATGQPAVEPAASGILGAERVTEFLTNKWGTVRSMLPQSAPVPAAPTPVATRCGACGAPLSGMRGAMVTCQYCDSAQQL